MKWTKVPPSANSKYFKAYEKLVDLYFEYNSKNIMFFRTLIVNKNDYDFTHEKFYKGDYEEGFYNLYCQLILNWLQKSNEYHIRIAHRPIKKASRDDCEEFRLNWLKEKLNNKFESTINKYSWFFGYQKVKPPVITIESREARERRLIQIADILMGAVGFYWNKEHLKSNVRNGKLTLAKYIASKLGRNDLLFTTKWNDKRFNIFLFDTSKTKLKK
ncbi:conserved domain protein [Carboxydothermus hydrogenoformans Z-2901]|uniref:Conserved domain protein n=2 Tax=Carboxydothermus hydrogenoformans TaxID=129958 RepID=Q3ABG3_CARHZ|nr:conserved domain protein [Carboxydothermus hydrogenoformans Z-2901]